jgi:hypothetical protein
MHIIRNSFLISEEDQNKAWKCLNTYGGTNTYQRRYLEAHVFFFLNGASDSARKDHYKPIFEQGEERDETDANFNTVAWPRWELQISLEEFQLPPDLFTSMANHVLGKREELAGLHGEKTVFLYSVGSTEPVFQRTHSDFCADTPRWLTNSVPLSLVINIDQKDAILGFFPYSIKGATENDNVQ